MAKGFKRKYFSLAAIAATVSMVQLNAIASSVVEIEKVVVSASKEEEPVKETTEDIEVITSEEIEEKGLKSLKDLMNYVSGTALTSNGGIGKSTSIYLRGLNNNKVLILIDGVRYNDPSNFSGPSIEHLLLNNIERVEIIKGAQSGIWGADAASGVINIITKPATKQLQTDLYVEKGSFDTRNVKASLSQVLNKIYYNLNFNYFQTDGYSAATPYNEDPKDYERDGYINRNFQAKLGYMFNGGYIEIGGNYIDADNEADNYNTPNSKYNDTFKYFSNFVNSKYLFNSHNLTIHLDKTKTEREFLDATWGVKYFEGKTKNIEIRDRYTYMANSYLQIGLEYQKFESFYKEVNKNENNLNYSSKSIYFVNKNRLGKFLLTENLRYDDYDAFDDQITGKIGVKYFILKDVSIFTNYATAYNPPNQIKMLNPWGKSNYNLQPEKTRSFDVGFEVYGVKGVYFEERVKDLINWYDPDYNVWQDEYYKNYSGTSKFKGIEISYKKDILDDVLIELGYTYLSAKDSQNKDLARRAKRKYSYSLTWYPTDEHTININGYYVGTRYDDVAKTKQTGKYNVTNVSLSHQFAKNFKGYVKIDNIFDRKYQEIYGYGTPGRSYYVGIKGSF